MIRSLDDADLARYVATQLNNMFPDGRTVSPDAVADLLSETTARVEHCFSKVNNKFFFDGRDVVFSHLHGDQYAMFLYLASNTAHRRRVGGDLAAKLFLLNKALHGIDAYYEVDLPSVFLFVHPMGTVLGRGHYSDYFIVYQRCGVGSNRDQYPTLKDFVTLRPGSSVLGGCTVGSNCTLGADSLLIDTDLPDNTLYIGRPGASRVLARSERPGIWRS